MMELKVKTVSPQAGQKIEVDIQTECRQIIVKNFSEGDIWVSLTANATKVDGMVRIPSYCAQVISCFDAGDYNWATEKIYVYADTASENTVEVQAVGW